MSTAAPRFGAIVLAVYDLLAAELPTCKVLLGNTNIGDQVGDYVIVGGQSDGEEADLRAGTFSQEYRTMAGPDSWRDESGSINCQIWTQDGDHKAVRATFSRAFSHFGAISDALRESIDLGDQRTLRVEVGSGSVDFGQTTEGADCIIRFQVAYTSVI